MNPRLHSEITRRLDRDFQFKSQSGMLRRGICPACKERELYTNAETPWVLRCGRLKNCGAQLYVKDLYSDLFEDWSAHHPVTPTNPTAAADAYLSDGRGFDLARIKGWYTQENYWNRELNQGSATVRFALPGVGYWERIIDRPHRFGKRKANFQGSYQGTWWQAPDMSVAGIEELWIVEGIFDAIALLHAGIPAVAALTCNNYPSAALQALGEQIPLGRPRLVFAFDGDRAGRDYTKRFIARAIEDGWEACAAQIPQHGKHKLDWNDLWQREQLTKEYLRECRYHGDLLMAASASEKARLIFAHTGLPSFNFDFDNRIFFWKLDIDKQSKVAEQLTDREQELPDDEREALILKRAEALTEVCNCRPVPLYFLKNEVTDEAWYYFRIDFPHGGPSVKNTFTAGQLTAPAEFKKRLLHTGAGAIWSGTAGHLDRLLKQWTYGIKRVETIDYIGYSSDHKAYVFDAIAVQGERVVGINDEDYFDLGKLSIKSLSKSLKLDIATDEKGLGEAWFQKLVTCFGTRGLVALAAWFGSLFAEQFRDRFESWPFIEIVGEPGAGKSTLIEFLWKLVGRTGYEGFDPLKGSMVGFMRTMAQVSNLPVVLIESDRDSGDDASKGRPKSGFHWDSLKSLFNGGSLRTTGVKSSGNDTYDPQFRAALFISQNAAVQASPPIMERIVHLWFDKSGQSSQGREVALELGRMSSRDVSGFVVRAITKAAAVLDLMEQRLLGYERHIEAAGVKNLRIQKNHAQLMVCVDALSLVCPITEQQQAAARQQLVEMAQQREQALRSDHPIVEAFWEAFDFLDGPGLGEHDPANARLNHSKNPELIAVNLNHFVQVAAERRQQVPLLSDLKTLLKSSKNPAYIEQKPVSSAINARRSLHTNETLPSSVKCWVFKR